MALFSGSCKICTVHPVGCHASSFEVASLGFLSGRYGKFIVKWRLPGADFWGDPASGSLALPGLRSPEVMHGAALVRAQAPFGLRVRSPTRGHAWCGPCQGSGAFWPLSVFGLMSGYGVGGNGFITTVCRVQAGNAALSLRGRGWGRGQSQSLFGFSPHWKKL